MLRHFFSMAWLRPTIAWVLILLLFAGIACGQTAGKADKIRRQVVGIGTLGTITVTMAGSVEFYGSIRSIDTDTFTINEVDQQKEITLRYADVQKVRSGYGTTRNLYGRRIHPHTKLIVTLAVLGGLLALVFVAVASDHS